MKLLELKCLNMEFSFPVPFCNLEWINFISNFWYIVLEFYDSIWLSCFHCKLIPFGDSKKIATLFSSFKHKTFTTEKQKDSAFVVYIFIFNWINACIFCITVCLVYFVTFNLTSSRSPLKCPCTLLIQWWKHCTCFIVCSTIIF